MAVEILEGSFEGDCPGSDIGIMSGKPLDVEARRRLEEKLDDIRLQRELREFDIDS